MTILRYKASLCYLMAKIVLYGNVPEEDTLKAITVVVGDLWSEYTQMEKVSILFLLEQHTHLN